MFRSASKPTFLFCFLACFLKQTWSEERKEVKPGDDVTLPCHGPSGSDIKLLIWKRTDIESDEGFVYASRLKRFNKDEQHPHFLGRVELKDPQMKDGDVSVILRNININDTGTYECHVGYKGQPELISTIKLTVTDSGGQEREANKGGHGGTVSVTVIVLLLVVVIVLVVVVVLYKKCKGVKTTQLKVPTQNDSDHQ